MSFGKEGRARYERLTKSRGPWKSVCPQKSVERSSWASNRSLEGLQNGFLMKTPCYRGDYRIFVPPKARSLLSKTLRSHFLVLADEFLIFSGQI